MAQTIDETAAITWSEANQAYLRVELHRLRLLFRRKVRWLRRNWQLDPLGNNLRVVISDAHADRMLRNITDGEEVHFWCEDAESCAITDSLKELEADLAIRRQGMTESGGIPSLEALARSFGLKPFERDVILMCFAIDGDPSFATLCAYVQDDANARYTPPSLASSLFCQEGEDREAALEMFLPSAPLRRFKLLSLTDVSVAMGLSSRQLRIDERVSDYVRGINRLDESVVHLLRPVKPVPIIGVHQELVDQLVRWASSTGRQAWPPIHLTGSAGAGKRGVAREFAARAGLELYTLDPRRLPLQDAERHQLLHLMERETVLSRIAVYMDVDDVDPADKLLATAVRDWIELSGGLLFVGARERWSFERHVIHIAVPKLDAAAQQQIWIRSLEGIVNSVDHQIDGIVQQF